MFWKRKTNNRPKPGFDPEPTGVFKRPIEASAEEERTETLKLLLGSEVDGVALQDDTESGADPHDNSVKHSNAHDHRCSHHRLKGDPG